jgi:hypothetical protein
MSYAIYANSRQPYPNQTLTSFEQIFYAFMFTYRGPSNGAQSCLIQVMLKA